MPIKLTKKREQILSTLKEHHGSLSAKEIHDLLPEIDLATIYRNLDLFVKEKLIAKLYLAESEATYEYQDEHHHHAVCSDCHKIIHFKAPDRKIIKLLGLKNFEVDEIEVTVKGRHTN